MPRKSSYVLDTSAILALRGDEAGADRIEAILRDAAAGKARVLVSFMSRLELLYRISRDEGEESAAEALRLLDASGVEWVSCDDEILRRAARLKAAGGLSIADAWIAATALLAGAPLVHKDPEFDPIQGLAQARLPD